MLATESRGIARVVHALERHGFDLPVLYVNGRREHIERQSAALNDFVVVQFCLRSTQKPHTRDWIDLWRRARVVWSYYDLYALCREDGTSTDFNFYHAPLGVENEFQFHSAESKSYAICTNGTYTSESVRECILAAEGEPVMHIGEPVNRPNVDYYTGVSDEMLCDLYASCRYVSGLRRVEGFELPAAEGLVSGTRPVLFDQPHYRAWYDGLAVFVPEGSRGQVIDSVRTVLAADSPVSAQESAEARARFNWGSILAGLEETL